MSASASQPGTTGPSSCLAPERLDVVFRTARQRAPLTGAALSAWAETLLACELARCQSSMAAQQWAEHREWIEANARESLRTALLDRAERGAL